MDIFDLFLLRKIPALSNLASLYLIPPLPNFKNQLYFNSYHNEQKSNLFRKR